MSKTVKAITDLLSILNCIEKEETKIFLLVLQKKRPDRIIQTEQ